MTPEDNRPATKQDLDRAVESIAAAIRAEIQANEDRGREFARGIEASLLTAFHGHAKGQTARLHTAELTTHDVGIRIAALEERVLNIETRQRPSQ